MSLKLPFRPNFKVPGGVFVLCGSDIPGFSSLRASIKIAAVFRFSVRVIVETQDRFFLPILWAPSATVAWPLS